MKRTLFVLAVIVATFIAIAFTTLTVSASARLISAPSDSAVIAGVSLFGLIVLAWSLVIIASSRWITKKASQRPWPKHGSMWLALAFVALVATGCSTSVPPGYVGIKVNQYGSDRGVSSFPLVTGRVWYNPWNEYVLTWPTFVQTAKWTQSIHEGKAVNEEITFTNADQMQIAADISTSYHLVPQDVPAFYVKFRTADMEAFTHGYMRNVARDMFDKHAGKYKIEQIMGDNADFLNEVRSALQAEVKPLGVVIDQFGLIGAPRPPESVTAAINEKAKANQIAVQKQIELIQTQADAAKEVAQAEGHANAVLKAARAQAEANRMLSESLTDKLISLKHLEKWDGKYPLYTGGGATPLIQMK